MQEIIENYHNNATFIEIKQRKTVSCIFVSSDFFRWTLTCK